MCSFFCLQPFPLTWLHPSQPLVSVQMSPPQRGFPGSPHLRQPFSQFLCITSLYSDLSERTLHNAQSSWLFSCFLIYSLSFQKRIWSSRGQGSCPSRSLLFLLYLEQVWLTEKVFAGQRIHLTSTTFTLIHILSAQLQSQNTTKLHFEGSSLTGDTFPFQLTCQQESHM